FKIANPAVLARIGGKDLDALLRGYGYEPTYVSGDDPPVMHEKVAAAGDAAIAAIQQIQAEARTVRGLAPAIRPLRPAWPMIVLRSPKGWTGPTEVDGLPVEGTWRSHQVPLAEVRTNTDHLRLLVDWLMSYRPAELFDPQGRP